MPERAFLSAVVALGVLGVAVEARADPAIMDELANEPEDNVGLFLGATFSFLFLK